MVKLKYKKLQALLSIITVVVLFACNSDRIYESHDKNFKDYRWFNTKILTFTPEISDTIGEYKIYLALRHVYGFQLENIRVKVTCTSPSAKMEVKDYKMQFMGPDKNYLGACAGDICDLEELIEDHKEFHEAGTYTYTVEHLMPLDYIPNV
ncbi:MAG: hypothetical protein ISR55_08905, partial [Bacteroidetes bacterium]|nr:hypothetical protein [Bacteroidota bacterium]